MSKVKPKVSAAKKRPARVRRKKRRRAVVELKAKVPSTIQKTVRVPVETLAWLEKIAAQVPGGGVSVPAAIMQIVQAAYQSAQQQKKSA